MTLTETPPTPAESRRPRAAPVRLALVGTFLIFAACAVLLIHRGATVAVPEAVLIVRASPSWAGTKASVDGINLGRPREALIDKRSKYTISFHLIPGDYTLIIDRGEIELNRLDFKLSKREPLIVHYLPAEPGAGTTTTRPVWPFGVDDNWPGQ